MGLFEVGSLIVGVGGFLFGAYTTYNSRSEAKEKERRRSLSKELNGLRNSLEFMRKGFQSPLSLTDTSHQLELISKDLIVFNHFSDETPTVNHTMRTKDGEIASADQALATAKSDDGYIVLNLEIYSDVKDENMYRTARVSDHISHANNIYEDLHEIDEDYRDILDNYDPSLYNDTEDILDNVIFNSYEHVLNQSPNEVNSIVINDSIGTISRFVFYTYWNYDGIDEDMKELSDVIDRIEESRKLML